MSYDEGGVSRNFRDGMNLGGDQGGDGLGQDTYGGTDPLGQGAGGDGGYGGGEMNAYSGAGAANQAAQESYGGDQTSLNEGSDMPGGGKQTRGGYGGEGDNTDADQYAGGNVSGGQGEGDDTYGAGDVRAQRQQQGGYGGDGGNNEGNTDQQYTGRSGGLGSDPAPTYGAAGQVALEESMSQLPGGGTMHPGQTLTSPNGSAKLVFQSDGNLVAYKGDSSTWSTGTDRSKDKPAILAVQEDGNLVLYDKGGHAVWATNTSVNKGKNGGGQLQLAVSEDGVVVLLDGEEAVWSSSKISPDDARALASSAGGAGGGYGGGDGGDGDASAY